MKKHILGVKKAHFEGKPPLCCSVDNSEYMRNGDFLPTRLQAQQDAVNIVCHSKTRSNPENNVGLITLAKYGGLGGSLLALKHRQGKNHKMRIIAFVGSPVEDNEKDLVKLAKRLKKEKVNVDIINFGEEVRLVGSLGVRGDPGRFWKLKPWIREVLEVKGKERADPGEKRHKRKGKRKPQAGSCGCTPAVCQCPPCLCQALRVSMEEQRQRQGEEARRAAAASAAEAGIAATAGDESDDALLKMTITQQEFGRAGLPDLSSMTEEEQIAYAMQMSLQGAEFAQAEAAEVDSSAMDTSEPAKVSLGDPTPVLSLSHPCPIPIPSHGHL
ncbi:26S proteasome non-ATPase regulatory subunit 4 [Manacus vitellinus]|uniref:26S proteasome non-ATPase regulatory subunit 4 n=1 Tax=Manacus vitellinus TaxID=328815 RepID=UPI00115E2A6B|nr:26S proteasome non-ATPase regulatory subunit 4 [Manacus vitellinus]